jgi:nucleoside-diphosphate kinase
LAIFSMVSASGPIGRNGLHVAHRVAAQNRREPPARPRRALEAGPGRRYKPGRRASRPVITSRKERSVASERTLSIIKPDATRRNITGKIIDRLESAGLRVVAQKRIRLTRERAEAFYAVHRERPFFDGLVSFMTSGPVVVQVLEGENAVQANREVMGATNPADAALGTIRKDFAENIEANSVHGSDSADNAKTEIAFFFAPDEIVG